VNLVFPASLRVFTWGPYDSGNVGRFQGGVPRPNRARWRPVPSQPWAHLTRFRTALGAGAHGRSASSPNRAATSGARSGVLS